jgi:hypothetical protein
MILITKMFVRTCSIPDSDLLPFTWVEVRRSKGERGAVWGADI